MQEQAQPDPHRSTCREGRKSDLLSPQAWRGDDGARQVITELSTPAMLGKLLSAAMMDEIL